MQRFEYKVISLRDGRYTESLNEYGRDGWELVDVVCEPPAPAPEKRGRALPMPRALERIEDAAGKIGRQPEPEDSSSLLWVLRRPLDDD